MLNKEHKFLNKNLNMYIYERLDCVISNEKNKETYWSAPARNRISVVIVKKNDTRIENINVIILRSNHHQNATHRNANVNVK